MSGAMDSIVKATDEELQAICDLVDALALEQPELIHENHIWLEFVHHLRVEIVARAWAKERQRKRAAVVARMRRALIRCTRSGQAAAQR